MASRRAFVGMSAAASMAVASILGSAARRARAGILDQVHAVVDHAGTAAPDSAPVAETSKLSWPARRYVATPALEDGAHLFVLNDGAIEDPAPLSRTYGDSLIVGPSGRVCYRLEENVSDAAGFGFAVYAMDESGERLLDEGPAFPAMFTLDDSLLLVYGLSPESGRATVYDVATGAEVFSETNVSSVWLSPYGTYLYYTYSDFKTLCRRNMATGEEVDIDEGVEQILLGSDDGACLYVGTDGGDNEAGAKAAYCYDGGVVKAVQLLPEEARDQRDDAVLEAASTGSLDMVVNAAGTELMYRGGDILTMTNRTYVYVLGEDAPRELPSGWAGDWDHADRYTTFLDPLLAVHDPFSDAILRDWIVTLFNLPTEDLPRKTFYTDVWPSWTEDNRALFYVADGMVYLHEMGSTGITDPLSIGGGTDRLIYEGADASAVVAAGNDPAEPYVYLADGTFGRLRNGSVTPLLKDGDQFQSVFWAPLNGKLAVLEKNGSLDLIDPEDDSIARVDKMTNGADLVDDVIVYRDQDGYVFAVGVDGAPVQI